MNRQPARIALQLRTSSRSNSDPLHHRSVPDRMAKQGDRRSSCGRQSAKEKKLASSITDLESRFGRAQKELKQLKAQLASSEAAKRGVLHSRCNEQQKCPHLKIDGSNKTETNQVNRSDDRSWFKTDVYDIISVAETKSPASMEQESDEIDLLKAKLAARSKELEAADHVNESLKIQLNKANTNLSFAKTKEGEIALRLTELLSKLDENKENVANLNEKLESVEKAKQEIEEEMKKLRLQTQKWELAADAAAEVLNQTVMMGEPTRRKSQDNHLGVIFDAYVSDPKDEFGVMYRKGSGFRVFGDLWKIKG